MHQALLLMAVAALGTSGCSGSTNSTVVKPDATVEAPGTAAAPAGSPEPAAATAATLGSTPAPPLPESFRNALALHAAAQEKLHASLLAGGQDCTKLAATVLTFARDEANATTCQQYFAEEAKLTPSQKASLSEHPTTLKLLEALGKTTEAHLKCTNDPKHGKSYGAAWAKMEAICTRPATPASSGGPAQAPSGAPATSK